MEKLQFYVMQGGAVVVTSGVNSTTKVQKSYPLCTITVYNAGTLTLSTIYSDNSSTPKSNPFLSSSTGYGFFYAANGRYDVTFSGTGITSPFTLSDYLLQDLSSGGITSINGLTVPAELIVIGTAGTDIAITALTDTNTIDIPDASAASRGALTSTDWSTFDGKQDAITVTAPITLTGVDIALDTVPVASGGTASTTANAAFNTLAPSTTKGDLIGFSTVNARLAVGTNGYVLTADSAQTTGLKWAASTDPFWTSSSNDLYNANTGNVGIGGAPGNFKLDISKSGSTGTGRYYDQTASTGTTTLVLRAGAGQSTNNLMQFQNNAGTVVTRFTSAAAFEILSTGSVKAKAGTAGFTGAAAAVYQFSDNADIAAGTVDTGIGRSAAGVAEANNGTQGTLRDFLARKLACAPVAFSALPAAAAGNKGYIACVTDSSTATWGATITGGAGNIVLAWSNGTNWTVIGA